MRSRTHYTIPLVTLLDDLNEIVSSSWCCFISHWCLVLSWHLPGLLMKSGDNVFTMIQLFPKWLGVGMGDEDLPNGCSFV